MKILISSLYALELTLNALVGACNLDPYVAEKQECVLSENSTCFVEAVSESLEHALPTRTTFSPETKHRRKFDRQSGQDKLSSANSNQSDKFYKPFSLCTQCKTAFVLQKPINKKPLVRVLLI